MPKRSLVLFFLAAALSVPLSSADFVDALTAGRESIKGTTEFMDMQRILHTTKYPIAINELLARLQTVHPLRHLYVVPVKVGKNHLYGIDYALTENQSPIGFFLVELRCEQPPKGDASDIIVEAQYLFQASWGGRFVEELEEPASAVAANLESKKRDTAKAIEDAKKEVLLDPNNAHACNQLAWVLSTCPFASLRDAGNAVQNATKACELSSWKDPRYIDTLAAAYADSGNFDEAVKWETKFLEFKLSDRSRASGRYNLARYQQKKPLHLDLQ